MDKNKRRLFVKVLAIILTIASIATLVLPLIPTHVHAEDMTTDDINIDADGNIDIEEELMYKVKEYLEKQGITEPSREDIFKALEQIAIDTAVEENELNEQDENYNPKEPPMELGDPSEIDPNLIIKNTDLPDGFQAIMDNGFETIVKSPDNNGLGLHLISEDTIKLDKVIVFLGNLETKKVYTVEFTKENKYLASASIPDGYYVLYSNGYAWNDGNVTYSINNNKPMYIHHGDNFDPDKYYTLDFVTKGNVYEVSLIRSTQTNLSIVQNGSDFKVSESDLQFPEEYVIELLDSEKEDPVTHPTIPEKEDQNDQTQEPKPEKEKVPMMTMSRFLKQFFLEPILLWILLIGCGVGLLIIRHKKEKELSKNLDNDKYDDSSVL